MTDDNPQATLDALVRSNGERVQRLAQQGLGINFLAALVEALVDFVLVSGTEPWVEFRTGWELKAAGLLDGAEAELRRRKLMGPIQGMPPSGPPRLIVDGGG